MTDKYIEGIMGLLAGFMVGNVFTLLINNATWRDETVESGHAEYYLDAKHVRQWRWKSIAPPTISFPNDSGTGYYFDGHHTNFLINGKVVER